MPLPARSETKGWARETYRGVCNVTIPSYSADLSDIDQLASLPRCPTVFFLAGVKFGTAENPELLDRMAAVLWMRRKQRRPTAHYRQQLKQRALRPTRAVSSSLCRRRLRHLYGLKSFSPFGRPSRYRDRR